MNMKQCFGYIRVSTVRQGDGVSLQEQKAAISSYAEKHNLTITEWFEEQETAAKSGRPVFTAMLKKLRRQTDTGLIIHKIDRSARNLKDWAIVSELPDEGIAVHIATESVDFTTRGGRLTADMLAVIAADYIRNLREEVKKGIRGRLKQGLYPLPAPIGYLDNGSGKAKTLCPVTAPLIREAFERYGTGQYSLRSLRKEMKHRGLRNKSNRPLSLCGIETILKNPFYMGVIAIRATGETYDGIHQPIVSAALFNRVQEIKSKRCAKKQTRHNYLFRGLFRCGLCAGPMTPGRYKGRVYYCCQRTACQTKTIREDVLDGAIHAALAGYRITPETEKVMTALWNRSAREADTKEKQARLQMRIAGVEQQLKYAGDLLVDGTIDRPTYLTKKRELLLTLATVRSELENLPNPGAIAENRKLYLELMKNLALLYASLNDEEKRIFVENAILNRTVIKKSPYFTPQDWLTTAPDSGGVFCSLPHKDIDETPTVPIAIQRLFERYFGNNGKE